MLILPNDDKIYAELNTLKAEWKRNPDVINIASAVNDPTNIYGGYFITNDAMGENGGISINATPVDEDYIKTAGLHLVTGNGFTKQDMLDASHQTDSENLLTHCLPGCLVSNG